MRNGEIWLVKMDKNKSVGHEYYKDRPALIIMSNRLIPSVTVVTIMPMSTSLNSDKFDIAVKKDAKNRLYDDSIIKVNHVQSFDKSRFFHKIGDVDPEVMKQIKKYLKIHFEL